MNKLLEYRIKRQIEIYKKKPSPILSGIIFNNVRDHIICTLKSNFRMSRRYRTDEELLSIAWDVFTESLELYIKGISVTHLLSNRCRLYVNRVVAKERRNAQRTCSLDVVSDAVLCDDSQRVVSVPMIDIKEFRKSLSPEYRMVFDDALKSIGGNNQQKTRNMDCPLAVGKYYESKNVFKMLISYFLKF